MLCAAPRNQPLLTGDAWSMFFSILLGITNGYFGSVPMIIASTKVPDEQKEITGEKTLDHSENLSPHFQNGGEFLETVQKVTWYNAYSLQPFSSLEMLFLRNLEMNNSIGWSKKYALHPP
jgi:hypothetical protein